MRVLAGDIGGTNARIAVVDVEDRRAEILVHHHYPSHQYPGLGPIVRRFVEEAGEKPDRACFGIACPVVGDDCTAPNLPWTVNARRLAAEIGVARAGIINDFLAVGYGLPLLRSADVATLQEGVPDEHGPMALIGAGTGLGQGFLIWSDGRHHVLPSEGGHADLAPAGEHGAALWDALRREFGHVSCERILSGPGLGNVYRLLAGAGVPGRRPEVDAEMQGGDPAQIVTRHALEGSDARCALALDIFVRTYGAQAGNLALHLMATGGVYLAGGIAPRIVERLRDGTFLAAFLDKGRLSSFVAKVPVHVVINPNVGLLGAASAASRLP